MNDTAHLLECAFQAIMPGGSKTLISHKIKLTKYGDYLDSVKTDILRHEVIYHMHPKQLKTIRTNVYKSEYCHSWASILRNNISISICLLTYGICKLD